MRCGFIGDTHLEVELECFRVHVEELHAGTSVAETPGPQVDVIHTGQLLHFTVAPQLPIFPQEVKGHNGALRAGVCEVCLRVDDACLVAVSVSESRHLVVDHPGGGRRGSQVTVT